jgi:hypothetical protein
MVLLSTCVNEVYGSRESVRRFRGSSAHAHLQAQNETSGYLMGLVSASDSLGVGFHRLSGRRYTEGSR